MLIETLVLKTDKSVEKVFRNLVIIDPDSVFLSVEARCLNGFVLFVVIIHYRGHALGAFIVIKIDYDLSVNNGIDIGKHRCSNDEHGEHSGNKKAEKRKKD